MVFVPAKMLLLLRASVQASHWKWDPPVCGADPRTPRMLARVPLTPRTPPREATFCAFSISLSFSFSRSLSNRSLSTTSRSRRSRSRSRSSSSNRAFSSAALYSSSIAASSYQPTVRRGNREYRKADLPPRHLPNSHQTPIAQYPPCARAC